MRTPRALLLAAVVFPTALFAHGELHEFITALEARLAEHPGDVKARVRLAEMHRLHTDRAAAERVLAALPDPKPPAFFRVHARLAEDAGDTAAALDQAARYCAAVPEDREGHALRARLLSKLGRWADEAEAWSEAIRLSPAPDATAFLAHATALARSGDTASALASVAAGIERHPREMALQERRAELLADSGALVEAIASLRNLRTLYPTLAIRWWQREADWLRASGRIAEARAACQSGLEAAQNLPPRQRDTPATRAAVAELEKQIAR